MPQTKNQKAARKAAYARQNSKKIKRRMAKYYRKHRKKLLSRSLKYAEVNRAEVTRRGRLWAKAYYRKNHKKLKKQHRRYYYRTTKKSHKRRRLLQYRYTHLVFRTKALRKRGVKGRPISLEQFRDKLLYPDQRNRPCRYCGHDVDPAGIGLDRINNRIGYTIFNVIPCCIGCNGWKNDRHTYAETMRRFKPMRAAVRH